MVREERWIATGVDRVWELLGDLARWDRLLPTMQQVTRVGRDGPVGVGDRFLVRQPGLPRAVYEITEWDPGQAFAWTASSPGVRTTAYHRLIPHDGGTRMVLGVDWSGPLAGLVRLLAGSKAARMVAREADTFTALAERHGRPG
jgi:uncharacterized protein YndB with AHSA1/START domain